MHQTEGVPYGRLFCFRTILCLGFLFTHPAAAETLSACHGENFDGHIRIEYVIDGDTVITGTGEHIRLIGIDTPEIDHEGSASEPGAEAARNYLIQLLRRTEVDYPVIYDRERHDRHGRTLAHLFLPDGENIQGFILSQGLATPLTIPPNLLYLECYQKNTDQAYNNHRGLWSLPHYQPVNVKDLTGKERGYHLVKGVVTRVSESRSSIWINLGREFAIRILQKNLDYFHGPALDNLTGKTILVRGKIYKQNQQLRIYLLHASDMQILAN